MSSFTERRQRVTDTARPLVFVDIKASSFPDTLRIVDDNRNWVSNGVEYIGLRFGFKMPADVTGQPARAQLVISNVGRGMTDDLERLAPGEVVMAKMMVADKADPHTYNKTLYLPMTQVSVNKETATAQCGVDFIMRQRSVRVVCNQFTLPGAMS